METLDQALIILKENGIRVNPETKWTEEEKGKIYSSNALELIHIHPDKIKYWEDIRCKRAFEIMALPVSKSNLWKF